MAVGRPLAIVLIIHGFYSHSGYYDDFAGKLVDNNYEVYAMDMQGFGNSAGDRNFIPDRHEIIADIGCLRVIAADTHPGVPVYLFGHAAGGLFSALYTAAYPRKIAGLITTSLALQFTFPDVVGAMIRLIGKVLPRLKLLRFDICDLSRDAGFERQVNNDPLMTTGRVPARTSLQILTAADELKKALPFIAVPVLVLHGTANRIVRAAGSRNFHDNIGSRDKQLKFYEGHYHDLLHDKYNAIVVRDIIDWLNARSGIPGVTHDFQFGPHFNPG